MLFSIIINYIAGIIIQKSDGSEKKRKTVLIISVIIDLGLLGFFKYAGFITENLKIVLPFLNIPVIDIPLPIGISFYTFQIMSYTIDVYRRDTEAQHNIIAFGTYVSLFPQLIAGPIVRYRDIDNQLVNRRENLALFSNGVRLFLLGLAKKVLIANPVGLIWDNMRQMQGGGALVSWVGIIAYTFQIYFDFSGYSDMAIGLGRMFGFHFLENFDFPYVAKSVTEFWRRWHISLGSWFRDYVYFPLGGSRVGSKFRLIYNLFVVWLLTGIWHGANWTFVLWGVLYGVFITVEKLLSIPGKIKDGSGLRWFWQPFTMLLVVLGWVLFRSESLTYARRFIMAMFSPSMEPASDLATWNFSGIAVLLALGVLCSMPIFRAIRERTKRYWPSTILHHGIQFSLFFFSLSHLVMKAHNPFIYFNF
jgi:alginate O-acetyltransferase complex protein AlgI